MKLIDILFNKNKLIFMGPNWDQSKILFHQDYTVYIGKTHIFLDDRILLLCFLMIVI